MTMTIKADCNQQGKLLKKDGHEQRCAILSQNVIGLFWYLSNIIYPTGSGPVSEMQDLISEGVL